MSYSKAAQQMNEVPAAPTIESAATNPYAVTDFNTVVLVTGSLCPTVDLPVGTVADIGKYIVVKDNEGQASLNPTVIQVDVGGGGGTIDNDASVSLDTDSESMTFRLTSVGNYVIE